MKKHLLLLALMALAYLPAIVAQNYEGVCPITGKAVFHRVAIKTQYLPTTSNIQQQSVEVIEANCVRYDFSFPDITIYVHNSIAEDVSFLLYPHLERTIAGFQTQFQAERKATIEKRQLEAKLTKEYAVLQKKIELWELEERDTRTLEMKSDSVWIQMYELGMQMVDGDTPVIVVPDAPTINTKLTQKKL